MVLEAQGLKVSKLRIVFMGTPHFAVPCLEALAKEFTLEAVVTVPDKKQGRGRQLKASPVKEKAQELAIEVLQPESLKDDAFINRLKEINPDIICVVAFRILPKEVYTIAKIASFNIHGSLLPKYRGAAPINWAIINGDKKTGLTSFILKEKVDTGSILLKKEIEIWENMTAGDLHDKMMPIAANLAVDTVNLIEKGDFVPLEQDDSLASAAPKIFREDCRIDWTKNQSEVINFIHGVSPIPGAWTLLGDKVLKIYRVEKAENFDSEEGKILIDRKSFRVQTNDGAVRLKELQIEGKKKMSIEDFLIGNKIVNLDKLV